MRSTAVVAALGLTALCLVGGCSPDSEPQGEPESSPTSPSGSETTSASPTPTSTPPPDGRPTSFDPSAQTVFPETGVIDAAAGRNVVLTLTPGTLQARRAADLGPAYTLTSADDDFTDVWARPDEGAGYVVETTTVSGDGTKAGRHEITVQRLDLATGEVGTTVTAKVPQDPRGSAKPATARITAVQGDIVVIDSFVPDTGTPHATVVVDLAAGEVRWRARGAEPLLVTPDLVVVSTGAAEDAGTVDARALRTGKRRWRALPGTLTASGVGTTQRFAVVVRDDNVFDEPTVTSLSLRNGNADPPRTTSAAGWRCVPTSRPIAVCSIPEENQVVGWDLRRNRARWWLPTGRRFAPSVTLVQDDLVYGLLDSGTGVVIDARTGKDVAGTGGAAPVALNAYGAMVLYGDRAIFVPAKVS